MDRTERFYKIQTMLMSRPSVTMKQMQEVLEVSRATLNRDLAYMRDRLGVPFAWDAGLRGYALTQQPTNTRTFELPGIWLSEQEIHSVLTMLEMISKLEPGGLLAPHVMPFKSRLEGLLQEGTGSANEASSLLARKRLGQALDAVGGLTSPGGCAVWHVAGLGQSVKECSTLDGWNGRTLNQYEAKGILVGALGVLAVHYGYGQ